MITDAGWISAGPGYRQYLFGERAFVDASAAISWRAYTMAQLRFELPKPAGDHLALGSQVRWQDLTQVDYFGLGPDSREGARSQYRLKGTNVVGYAAYPAHSSFSVGGTFGWEWIEAHGHWAHSERQSLAANTYRNPTRGMRDARDRALDRPLQFR